MESWLADAALQEKNRAAKRTLWGGVITAAIGAGGAIATAYSSSQQSATSGAAPGAAVTINGKDTTTALGAITAGVTAVGAAVTPTGKPPPLAV
jgi:hypothetical protein